MKHCKSCGKEIKYHHEQLLGDFCGEVCFWKYEDKKDGKEVNLVVEKSVSDEFYFGMIKKKIKERKVFIISSKTLEPYKALKAFENFMVENNFMIVRHDSELSVIKKSIV